MAYNYDYDYDYDDERSELRRQDANERQRRAAFLRHPDPRDPDFPGDDDGDAGD